MSRQIMNSNDTPLFFSSCTNYEPQPWSCWRQDGCFPYYSEPVPAPINPQLDLPSIQTDASSSSCTNGATECNQSNEQPKFGEGKGTLPKSHPQEGTPREPIAESHLQEKAEPLIDLQRQEATSSDSYNSKKKRDRFNGMTEEDVLKRTVPDLLCPNLDIIIIGSCPGLTAAYLGHHYAGPGNHFWKCLYLSGLIPEPMNASDDYKLKQYGIGFTNFVARCSKGSVEFSRYAITREIKEGVESLTEKIQTYKPKIAVFNGKGIYEVFCNHKNFYIGKQPEPFPGTNTVVYVMPSSSARCSQLPRASDKVPFFVALRKLRDHLRGCLPNLDETEVIFPDLDLKVEPRKDRRMIDETSLPDQRASGHISASADRKRKHVDCNFNAVDVTREHVCHPSLPSSSFSAVPQDASGEFKWNSGFHKWPPAALQGIAAHSSAAALVGMNSRVDCTYDKMVSKQEENQLFNACGLLRSLPSGPFYGGWGQNRWMMNGLATRFNGDACYPINIPTYLQYPDMISGHLPESSYRSMYPNLSAYSQEAFLPDPATSAPSSAFSYNSSLSHDVKAPGSHLDPVFFQRPGHSPPSYYHQYR